MLYFFVFVATLLSAILLPLASSETVRGVLKSRSALTAPPTKLSALGVIELFVFVLLKYIFRGLGELLGLLSRLQYDEGTREYYLPECSVSAPLSSNFEDVASYSHSISSTDPSIAHTKAPLFLLAPLTSPLLLHLLTKYTNPILPLGAVNVRNRFEFLDADACQDIGYSHKGKLEATATMGGSAARGRAVKRGMEIDITVVVTLEGRPIFRMIFTVLQFLRHKNNGIKSAVNVDGAAQDDTSQAMADVKGETMKIDFNAPNKWARLCKDYNPIHVNPYTARLFGFPGKIAHGNLVVAMVLERYPNEQLDLGGKPSYLDVDFRRPIVVPLTTTVKVLHGLDQGTSTHVSFRVASLNRNGIEKHHVDGRMGPL